MNNLAVILSGLLGVGGLGGLATLLRLRVDRQSTAVDVVSKGVLVLERLNDRLEADLAAAHARAAAAESALHQAEAALRANGVPLPPVDDPDNLIYPMTDGV